MLRIEAHYRMQSFQIGMRRAGYDVRTAFPPTIQPGDVLVIWNRHTIHDEYAKRFEAAGGRVVVVENGYIGKRHYAVAETHHNGAGSWLVGAARRWPLLGIEAQPWRRDGRHVLVLGQRGVGAPGVAMPRGWVSDVARRLKAVTDRPVRIREHPGKDKPSLAPDLKDCWAVVTWGSGAAVKAIVAGVPAFHELPKWIAAPAARLGIADIESPYLGERGPTLERLAWAQWTLDEIETGQPFNYLLGQQARDAA